MVLCWTNRDKLAIKELLDRVAKLESRLTLLETQNAAQKRGNLKIEQRKH